MFGFRVSTGSAGCTSTYAVEDVELDGAVVAVATTNGLAVQVLDRLQTQTIWIALVEKAAHRATKGKLTSNGFMLQLTPSRPRPRKPAT